MDTSCGAFTFFYLDCRGALSSPHEECAFLNLMLSNGEVTLAPRAGVDGSVSEGNCTSRGHSSDLAETHVQRNVAANAFIDTAVVATAEELRIIFASESPDPDSSCRVPCKAGPVSRVGRTARFLIASGCDERLPKVQVLRSLSQDISRWIGGGACVSSVACGFNHVLLATSSGRAFSLGENSQAQLGTGDFESSRNLRSVLLQPWVFVKGVCAGGDFSVAICSFAVRGKALGEETLRQDSEAASEEEEEEEVLMTWGSNEFGQLGRRLLNGETRSAVPSPIEFKSQAQLEEDSDPPQQGPFRLHGKATRSKGNISCTYTAAACGSHHTVALTAQGPVVAFGLNIHGQLGLGTLSAKELPAPMLLPAELKLPRRVCRASCSSWQTALVSEEGEVFVVGVKPAYSPPPNVPFNRPPFASSDIRLINSQLPHSFKDSSTENADLANPGADDEDRSSDATDQSCSSEKSRYSQGAESSDDAEPFMQGPQLERLSFGSKKVKSISLGPTLSCALAEDAHGAEFLHLWRSDQQPTEETTSLQLPLKKTWNCHAGSEGVFVWSY